MAHPEGVEPPTLGSEDRCSIQLSYGCGNRSLSKIPERSLRQVDFVFGGNEIRGLEQNPDTRSEWAKAARSGKKVMQFLTEGRYAANVVNGKIHRYGNQPREGETTHHTA